MVQILTYEQIDRQQWSKLVRESETGTWFQSPEAFLFFSAQKDLFEVFGVGVARVNELTNERVNELAGLCVGYVTKEKNPIKQFFTRRAIITGGPMIANDATSEEVETLMKAVRHQFDILDFRFKISGSPIYIETRNFNDYSRWREAFEAAGFEYKKHLNFHVDCTNRKAMDSRLSDTRRKQIRRAQATVECITNESVKESDIREWYGILQDMYRTRVKTPLWPEEFFIHAYRSNAAKYIMVKHEGRVIGGLMLVEDEKTVYEWFECGLDTAYERQYPSVMATYAGMVYAAEHGIARCDFMGAGEPGVPYGVRDFKERFGGRLVEHGRFLCVQHRWLYRLGTMGVRMMKHFRFEI